MTKAETLEQTKEELVYLNRLIDFKIIRGLSYKKESARHLFLVKHLNTLERELKSRNLTDRLLRVANTFIF